MSAVLSTLLSSGDLHPVSNERRAFKEWFFGRSGEQHSLFSPDAPSPVCPTPQEVIPRNWVRPAYMVFCWKDRPLSLLDRWVRRLHQQGPRFLTDPADPMMREFKAMAKAVGRDIHKAHAFVRFKALAVGHRQLMVAWHRPQHRSLDLFCGLFQRRFVGMDWVIVTPHGSAHWIDEGLNFGAGCAQEDFNVKDQWDDVWNTYYRSIFNPSRIKVKAMKKEMPMHYWHALPEARLIPELLRNAPSHHPVPALPDPAPLKSFAELPEALAKCDRCSLAGTCRPTSGSRSSNHTPLMIVGEQPGDQEEKTGRPFVGPAGRLLRKLLAEAGLSEEGIFFTNAVKHFKHRTVVRNGRAMRLHQRPHRYEIVACRPWMWEEFKWVKPKIVLCLGATAGLSVTGRAHAVTASRGHWLTSSYPFRVFLSFHPAALLRSTTEAEKQRKQKLLISDLIAVREELERSARAS